MPAFPSSLVKPGRRLAAAAVVLSLAACGGTATAGSTAEQSGGGAATASGTLKWGWALPTSWDPVTSSAGWDVHALSLVYAGLTQEDAAGNAVPALASSWKYNTAGTEITFTLRPNLTFSDGTPLDATAVKANIERGRDEKDSLIASQLTSVKQVSAPSPDTVVVDLAQPNFQIPTLFAGKTGMLVSPAAFTGNRAGLALKPVGAGPFTLSSYVQNSKASLVRNPKFWNASQIHIANFELYPLPDPSTAVAGLTSGQYSVAQIPGNLVAAAKSAGLKVQVIPSLVVSVLDVNNTIAPFDDPNVDQALKYAVDRKALLQTANFGVGDVSYQPFPKGYVGYSDAVGEPYAYNPDKAKTLLAASKYGAHPAVTITTSTAAGVPEQLQAQLQAVGFTVKIEVIPAAQFTQIVYVQHSRALTVDAFAGRDSTAQAFQVLFGKAGLLNPGRGVSPDLQAAVDKISTTPLDSPDYPAVVQAATALAVQQEPNVFLYTVPRILAHSSSVSDLPADTVVQRFEGVTAK
ncbi:extracellular solute-binding protein family 5 [Catenulispora acidiphila DSM 44928]|uniref:Extracellular solute-binding protein family 5 n=1 Tax=Catenulispora acidiphila (strain DSM 44928 / JCM 14897 / NBRC 102108 / NRRL B-24433 / ID139908) TaxID=479433 RepID=C7Q101_CATAD|nr:ABC transporter substrate-binding protein [Catenulispora acidiphila]ACU71676.1 extracellular solute-binding protein family 5 [Catenulispora acidiphila DSM 44928]